MKRLSFLFLLVLLVACNKNATIHEDVDKDLATDSLQVIEILEQAVNKKEEPSESNKSVLDNYIDKYGYRYENDSLEGINNDIYLFIEMSIRTLDRKISLESGKQEIEDTKMLVTKYIETGKTALDEAKTSK